MKRQIEEEARWRGYFMLDTLKGGAVRKRYEQNLHAYRHGTSFEETNERLRELITYAVRITTGYVLKGTEEHPRAVQQYRYLEYFEKRTELDHHSELHHSQTNAASLKELAMLDHHSELHHSQTHPQWL